MSTEKKLSNKFVFWYHIIDTSSDQDYKSQIKKLAQFETLEEFWSIFQYLKSRTISNNPLKFNYSKTVLLQCGKMRTIKTGVEYL